MTKPHSHVVAAGAAAYTALSVTLFIHVLSRNPAVTATCTCSDVSQFSWYFAWVAHAIAHFQNPFYSTHMFAPRGVNLLANTSSTGLAIPLVPLTWAFGSLFSLNVALIAAPVASAVAMMATARRFVTSSLAAFGAGLIYGFSPIVLFHEPLGHLNVTFLAVPPLVLWAVYELFVLRRHRPMRVGVTLGALVVWQFLLGTEVLAMMVIVGVVCGALAIIAVALRDPQWLRARRDSWRALGVAGLIAIVGVVPAALFALVGPAHLSGVVWPGVTLSNATVRSFVTTAGGLGLWWSHGATFLSDTYVSPTLLGLMIVGLIVFRRDRTLWAFSVFAAVGAFFALGQRYIVAPWHYLSHAPILENIVNARFSIFATMFAALALAVIADRAATKVPHSRGVWVAAVAVVVAVIPVAIEVVDVAPYRASALWVPQWYRVHASHLGPHAVVIGYPFFDTSANLLGVDAHFNDDYAVVGGTGPGWIFSRQGTARAGYEVLWDLASTAFRPTFPAAPTAAQRVAVADALAYWHATEIVVPITNGPNTSRVARDPRFVATWFAFLFHHVPKIVDGAWVFDLSPRRILAAAD